MGHHSAYSSASKSTTGKIKYKNVCFKKIWTKPFRHVRPSPTPSWHSNHNRILGYDELFFFFVFWLIKQQIEQQIEHMRYEKCTANGLSFGSISRNIHSELKLIFRYVLNNKNLK